MKSYIAYLYLLFLTCAASFTTYAQEQGGTATSTHTSTTTTTPGTPAVDSSWLAANWMWLAGGAIVLIILIALMTRGRKTVVERTTVVRDTNV